MSVFSDQQQRPTVVASDPQRGVGLDQTPLRVLATMARSRRRTSADIRRRGLTVQLPLVELAFAIESVPAASPTQHPAASQDAMIQASPQFQYKGSE